MLRVAGEGGVYSVVDVYRDIDGGVLADGRGLGGEHHQEYFATHNRYPDLEATSQNWGGKEDCGFCHRIGGNN